MREQFPGPVKLREHSSETRRSAYWLIFCLDRKTMDVPCDIQTFQNLLCPLRNKHPIIRQIMTQHDNVRLHNARQMPGIIQKYSWEVHTWLSRDLERSHQGPALRLQFGSARTDAACLADGR
jgi:hypothetical protein